MNVTAGELLSRSAAELRRAGIQTHRLDARLLLAHALGVEPLSVVARPERRLSRDEAERVGRLVARRAQREPLSHITGRREFWGLAFAVNGAVLDPRPDSETLVDAVLEHLGDRQEPLRVLDLGTGSGCLLLALLSELPNATGIGIDRSEAACAVARMNVQTLGLSRRAEIRLGDWGRGLDTLFDAIVSNPPYIPQDEIAALDPEVAGYEPREALAGGADGLECYRALVPDIARLLAPGGVAALEVGLGQAKPVAEILEQHGLPAVAVRRDLGGVERCVLAKRSRLCLSTEGAENAACPGA